MVIVSDASITGLRTAKRIQDLIKELDIKASKILLIVNRASKDIDNKELCDMEYCGFIAEDNKIQQISLNGGSLMDLDDQSDSLKSLSGIGDRIWQSS
jgi:CO dehydrogenase maturation factor